MPSFSILRPRYSLRALLVLMTLFALFFWYHWNWIHQRRAAIESGDVSVVQFPGDPPPPAFGLLWMFGERGYKDVIVNGNNDIVGRRRQAAHLFPEARRVSFP